MIDAKEIDLDDNYLIKESYGFVQPWFPKLIYFKDSLLTDHLTDWSDLIRDKLKEERDVFTETLPVKSNHDTDNLLEVEKLKPLWDTVLDHAYWYTNMMGYLGIELTLVNAWANISRRGDFLFPHRHNASLISGAFYLKASDTDKIMFMDDESCLLQPTHPNDLTWNKVQYDCNPGRLILFRSDTLHGVTRQESDEEKIVVSFNLIGNYKK
jgi:hypothetical protein